MCQEAPQAVLQVSGSGSNVVQCSGAQIDDWYGLNTADTVWDTWNYTTAATTAWQVWNECRQWTSASAWQVWNECRQWTSASTTQVADWTSWNDSYTVDKLRWVQRQVTRLDPVQVEAERAKIEAQRAKAEVERVAAEVKARKILHEHLTPAQIASLEKDHFFDVIVGREQKRRYRVHRKATHNVYLLDEAGKVSKEFCTVLPDCPLEDQLLLQMLYLRGDEPAFHEAANIRNHEVDEAKAPGPLGVRSVKREPVVGDRKAAEVNRVRDLVRRESGLLVPQ